MSNFFKPFSSSHRVPQSLLVFAFFGFSLSALAQSGHPQVSPFKELENYSEVVQLAKQKNLPILLMFGAEWCEFCEMLEEEVLKPMAISGDYEGKYTFLRHVALDDRRPFIDPKGKTTLKEKWAYELSADLTPTVVFLDWQGKEVAKRIVGIANIELYSAVIHQSLNQAYQALDNPLRIEAIQPKPIKYATK